MSAGPDIASLLAQMGGGQDGQPDQAGADQQPSGADALRQILDIAGQVANDPSLDDQDKLLLQKATTMIQQILADVQKGQHALIGGKMDPRAMARAAGGTGY